MATNDSSAELDSSSSAKIEVKEKELPKMTKDLIESFKRHTRHYQAEERLRRWNKLPVNRIQNHAQIAGLDQTLRPKNLDEIGIPTKVNETTKESLSVFVDYLFENEMIALMVWVSNHDEEREFFGVGNDRRIIEVSRLARKALKVNA